MFQNTPQQFIDSRVAPPQQPQPQQRRAATVDERVQYALWRLQQLRERNQSAFNQYTLKEVLDGVLNLLGFVLGADDGQQMQGPQGAMPVSYGDPNAARVSYNQGGAHPSPGAPITNGDVQFIPGPAAPATPVAGQQTNGQHVEYYGGPPGTPFAGGDTGGQRVEFYGGPPQPAQTAQPVAQPAQQPQYGQQPVAQPGQSNAAQNPTGATFHPGQPPINVEAGDRIPPLTPAGVPAAPAGPPVAVSTVPPDRPAIPPPPLGAPPMRVDDVVRAMPIPVAGVSPAEPVPGMPQQTKPQQE